MTRRDHHRVRNEERRITPSTPQPKARRKGPAQHDGQRLVRAILELPARLRDGFLLHRMAGMTYPEIGLHLGMTPETVQASLADALVRLMQAVPTGTPSSKSGGRSDAHRGQSKPEERLPRRPDAPWTGMPPTKNSGETSRRIKSDQTLSKVSRPHADERDVHNLGRRVCRLTTPEQS